MAREILQGLMFGLADKEGKEVPPCRHCLERARAPKSRGLCHYCRAIPAVAALYETLGRKAPVQRGGLDPEGPTRHPPGSEAKVAVLESRAQRGLCLWHPDDRGFGEC